MGQPTDPFREQELIYPKSYVIVLNPALILFPGRAAGNMRQDMICAL